MAQNTKSLIVAVAAASTFATSLVVLAPAQAARKHRADIADTDPTLTHGDWQHKLDGGFRFTAFGHAFDVDGKPIRLIEVDSVACESDAWGNGLKECLKEFKKQNHLEKE